MCYTCPLIGVHAPLFRYGMFSILSNQESPPQNTRAWPERSDWRELLRQQYRRGRVFPVPEPWTILNKDGDCKHWHELELLIFVIIHLEKTKPPSFYCPVTIGIPKHSSAKKMAQIVNTFNWHQLDENVCICKLSTECSKFFGMHKNCCVGHYNQIDMNIQYSYICVRVHYRCFSSSDETTPTIQKQHIHKCESFIYCIWEL